MKSVKIIFPVLFLLLLPLIFSSACRNEVQSFPRQSVLPAPTREPKTPEIRSPQIRKVLESAAEQTRVTKSYDPSYVVLGYPNGDVPVETGVCTDVIIRSFRKAGVDLQKEVHEDMQGNFAVYPKKWGLRAPDTNIDHRRVPNLQTFFTRQGKSLPVTHKGENYQPGDVVSWDLDGKGLTHIGVVSSVWNESTGRYSIIHNIGSGAKTEDCLFNWKITGHYRYFDPDQK
jgi:uncharacterized protein YijF (DUF1287 family)